MADETINRVTKKLPQIAVTYEGNPAAYFCGFVENIHHEYRRRRTVPALELTLVSPDNFEAADKEEKEYECLSKCMDGLPSDNRELVLQYYQQEKRAKIDHRKELARHLGIGVNALRIRAYRIRTILYECVRDCVKRAEGERIRA